MNRTGLYTSSISLDDKPTERELKIRDWYYERVKDDYHELDKESVVTWHYDEYISMLNEAHCLEKINERTKRYINYKRMIWDDYEREQITLVYVDNDGSITELCDIGDKFEVWKGKNYEYFEGSICNNRFFMVSVM